MIFFKIHRDVFISDVLAGKFAGEIRTKFSLPIHIAKFDALANYCKRYNLNCEYITETTYDISGITLERIQNMIYDKTLLITITEYNRLLRWI